MVSKTDTDSVFATLKQEIQNRKCFDCHKNNPEWASLSHATFICMQCAGIHRGLGVHISFVRSLTMDTWSVKQLTRMSSGGNSSLASFFERYEFPNQSIQYKYRTKAAAFYRESLNALVDDLPLQKQPPSLQEGIQQEIYVQPKRESASAPPPQITKLGIKGFFGKALDKGKNIGTSIAQRVKNIKEKPKVQKFKMKTSEVWNRAVDKTKPGLEKIKEKTRNAWRVFRKKRENDDMELVYEQRTVNEKCIAYELDASS